MSDGPDGNSVRACNLQRLMAGFVGQQQSDQRQRRHRRQVDTDSQP